MLTSSWECTSFAVVPPGLNFLFFFVHVSFPSSSICGLLLGTLRRQEMKGSWSQGSTSVERGGPALSHSTNSRSVAPSLGLSIFREGQQNGSSGSCSPLFISALRTHTFHTDRRIKLPVSAVFMFIGCGRLEGK